ncbi:S1 family peptidase [Actinomadura sp. 1N219]|uniref:S1 family peptidase n=1 Tax=Actinomadura sp. 1N219 TaxID=3375152 RepID=UPI0037A809B6
MLVGTLVAMGAPPGAAAAGPSPVSGAGPVLLVPAPGVGEKAARTAPKLIEAAQRDLRLTRAQVITRLGRQEAAHAVGPRARRAAGRHYAGSWLTEDGSALMIAVTDGRVASAVRAAGANPVPVAHRLGELETARLKLRDRAGKVPVAAVHGWHVDPARNRLVVQVAPGEQRAAAAWVAATGVPAALVAYDRAAAPQRATTDRLGGDPIEGPSINGKIALCTEGFSARPFFPGPDGFITAGHCAQAGDRINLLGIPRSTGTTFRSSFPNNDAVSPDEAFVQLNNPLDRVVPSVRSDRAPVPVFGTQPVSPGEMVCFYGNVSKFGCGRLLTTGVDVRLNFGDVPRIGRVVTVPSLNQASFCVAPGDSGGPVTSMGTAQAQGTLISSACPNGGSTSSYMPINQTELDLQVEVLRAGISPPVPPPVITTFTCYSFDNRFDCELYWEDGSDPDSVQVSTNSRYVRRVNDYDGNFVVLTGTCAPFSDTFVSVSVIDADGRRDSASRNSFCSPE